MPVWAWVLFSVFMVGFVLAALIAAAVYECTVMPFRRWDTLP